jgi:hypothetical protein
MSNFNVSSCYTALVVPERVKLLSSSCKNPKPTSGMENHDFMMSNVYDCGFSASRISSTLMLPIEQTLEMDLVRLSLLIMLSNR